MAQNINNYLNQEIKKIKVFSSKFSACGKQRPLRGGYRPFGG
jgi:hypothetical protein